MYLDAINTKSFYGFCSCIVNKISYITIWSNIYAQTRVLRNQRICCICVQIYVLRVKTICHWFCVDFVCHMFQSGNRCSDCIGFADICCLSYRPTNLTAIILYDWWLLMMYTQTGCYKLFCKCQAEIVPRRKKVEVIESIKEAPEWVQISTLYVFVHHSGTACLHLSPEKHVSHYSNKMVWRR